MDSRRRKLTLQQMDSYDPEVISEYFRQHPWELVARAMLISSSLVQVAIMLLQRQFDGLPAAIGAMGPTYVKFGQALASRSDIVGVELASALTALQDNLPAFSDSLARRTVDEELPEASAALVGPPVAAASLCQVYKGELRGQQVAIKVQRPGIREAVSADAALLRAGAVLLERTGAVKAEAVAAVDEFVTRLFEEMDFEREAQNLKRFRSLYCKGGTAAAALPPPGVVVPEVLDGLVSPRVLVMQWLEGDKLTDSSNSSLVPKEDLPLVELGIRCTLSQLIETGVMHADPHGGNLLKLPGGAGLAYLDFGLVSDVPAQVRDGLVAAVALLVFSRDYAAVSRLFGELMLIPPEVVEDEAQMEELEKELSAVANNVLVYPEGRRIPDVRFDQLLGALAGIVPKFRFVLPPYFVNNARALGTLEGMARSADPTFNIIGVVYPFALQRLLANPNKSTVLRRVVRQLSASNGDGKVSLQKLRLLLRETAVMSGLPQHKVAMDALKTSEGRSLAIEALQQGAYRAMQGFLRSWQLILERLCWWQPKPPAGNAQAASTAPA